MITVKNQYNLLFFSKVILNSEKIPE